MKELDLRSFFLVLLQNLRLIIAVAVAMAVVFGVAPGLLTKDTYSARCSAYIMNISKEVGNGSYTGISANGLDTSQKLVDECIVMIKSNRVMNEVADRLEARGFDSVSGEDVRASLTMTAKGTWTFSTPSSAWTAQVSRSTSGMVSSRVGSAMVMTTER